jgi:hypothetical protein
VGRHLDEVGLLLLGNAYQQHSEWHLRAPMVRDLPPDPITN